jgi:hypothetical protein
MKSDTDFNENEMRKELAKFLAPYMVPITIIKMKEMPRMPSGKIDRKTTLPDSFLVQESTSHIEIGENDSVDEKLIKVLTLYSQEKILTCLRISSLTLADTPIGSHLFHI